MLRFTIQFTRGLLRDQRTRRAMMFYGTIAAIVMVFAGAVPLVDWLRARPRLFVGYWFVVGWLTLVVMLLALLDLLALRLAGRRALRDARRRFVEEQFGAEEDKRDGEEK